MNRHLYIISGCNVAGKTTASYTVLPEILKIDEFVNADEIARGLSPFNPDEMAIEAGRLMLKRINELLTRGKDFAIETTLATRSYANLVDRAHMLGYEVHLVYFWLNSTELAKKRVASRVILGGHNIPHAIIERRYGLGIKNLFGIFIPIVDEWMIVNNSNLSQEIVAEGGISRDTIVYNDTDFLKIKNHGK
ncbi:zeta toxin family protein [Prevotella koreensis]|uniref:zeta toxin family protein n=1 Tax=Prevotella koreensis TaxID=2490854 RepID=UPI0028E24455|nr:zeta toxin family protein [Prevotella koreensis]